MGVLEVGKNSPNTILAGEMCSPSLGDVHMPRRPRGDGPSNQFQYSVSAAFWVRWVCSTIPLAAGLYAMMFVPISSPKNNLSCDMKKAGPWSEVMLSGTPK